MKRGVSTSSLGIIAVLCVAVGVGWMTYQNMAGTGVTDRITGVTASEETRALVETVKRTLKTDLIYSSQEASMKVASAGGGDTGTRYWRVGKEFTAPTEEEVLYVVSNSTLNLMNKFVRTEREQYASQKVQISDYDCVGSYNPSEEACYPYLGRDPEIADAFQNGLTGGTIEATGKDGQKDRYEGNIIADIAPNEFWPIYYTLYNFIRDEFNVIVTSTVRDECPDDTLSTSQKIIDGVEEACKKLQEEFCGDDLENCCINVTCEIECPDPDEPVDTSTCFQTEPPEPLAVDLCFEPKHTDEGKNSGETPSGQLIAQGTTTGSYRVLVSATDECHKLDAQDYLEWKLYIVDSIGTNCEVVDGE